MRQPGEGRPGPVVSPRHRREEPRGPAGEGRDEAERSAVVHRRVEQHHRHVEGHVDGLPGLDHGRGESIQLGEVDETSLVELPRVLPRQRVEVGPHRVAGRQRVGLDAARADIPEGRRQGPAEAAQPRDRREVAEGARLVADGAGGDRVGRRGRVRQWLQQLEGGAGGDRLAAEAGGGGEPAGGEARRRDAGGEPAQAEAVEAEHGAAAGRVLPDEVVDGVVRGADDERLGRRRQALDEAVRDGQPRRRARGPMKPDRTHRGRPLRAAHAPSSTRRAPRTFTPPA